MMMLVGIAALIGGFMVGACFGAMAVEDVDGDLRLPSGWWVLPGAILGGLLSAAMVVGAGI